MDRFANAIDKEFCSLTDRAFQAAVDFPLTEPARKQMLTGLGPPAVDPKQTEHNEHFIRSVRNNVAHGGKIQPEVEKEEGRNEKLVSGSLTILKHAVELNDKVRAKFYA